VSGKIFGLISSLAALALVAGCNSSDPGSSFSFTKKKDETPANASTAPIVVQGACPQIYLREGTAVFSQYAKGVKKGPDGAADPSSLAFQATLERTTRQCFQTDQGLRMTVVVQGRIIPGPMGQPGTFNLPIRVAASDGDEALYSELTQFPVTVGADLGATQFIFTKENIILAKGSTGLTRVFAGIDEGPYNTK